MLKSIYLYNFKSFAEAELPLEQLTLMIGSNASGKSNALEALWILSQLATGRELSVILDGERRSDGRVRGGSAACPRVPFQSFELGCTYQATEYDIEYRITIRVDDHIVVERESLKRITKDKNTTLFETLDERSTENILVHYLSDKYDEYWLRSVCERNASVLSQLHGQMLKDGAALKRSASDILLLREAFDNIFLFQPEAWRMRDYVRISERELRFYGENLSAVLYDLCEKKHCGKDILNVIEELPDNGIEGIDFIKTDAGDVMLALKELSGGGRMDARQLSDGTLRCLAILAAVYSEPEGSMIVVEELDNGIHPSRIAKLLYAVQQIAAERHLMLVITTHNPAVMDAVDPDHMDGVVLCYRDKEDGASSFRRIVDLPDYLRLVAKGTMGELAEQDAFVKSIREPHDTSKQDYSWMWEA
ncbi:AAA family ATPase [Selenomonas noxia]|mgnify:CR=1 FL=1|jgi:hypothetical protein|uniref:AAA family ATPase n=1 Tax=Selenomonas noxia TaxID=135083 RepID=UPI00235927CC|nr:ATP-binding protein [Selenomonas noxia]